MLLFDRKRKIVVMLMNPISRLIRKARNRRYAVRDSLPDAKKVLIMAPHPDDEALGCSGTIALLNRRGISSTVVFLTDGERLHGDSSADIAKIRKEEAGRASGMLGCNEPLFLAFPDGETCNHKEEIYRRLREIVEREKPDIIFSPSPSDFHNDHISAADIAMRLLREPGSFKLAFYEIYSTLRFTHLIDIAEAAEDKRKVILNYRVGLYGRPELYVEAALGLNVQRSLFTERSSYYEAFWITSKPLSDKEIMEWLTYKDKAEG